LRRASFTSTALGRFGVQFAFIDGHFAPEVSHRKFLEVFIRSQFAVSSRHGCKSMQNVETQTSFQLVCGGEKTQHVIINILCQNQQFAHKIKTKFISTIICGFFTPAT
jgi:hypothetical protein